MKDLFRIAIDKKNLSLDLSTIRDYCWLQKKQDAGRQISNAGGWQSNDLTGTHLVLNELFEDIEHYGNQYAQQLGMNKRVSLDNLWININEYKDFNLAHTHPHALISGTFYVSVPKSSGNICFVHPAANLINATWPSALFSQQSAPHHCLEHRLVPKENLLILFPAWLEHFVFPNQNSNAARISISFNLQ